MSIVMAHEAVRPLLIPQNRRLRHLRGVHVRNLTLKPVTSDVLQDALSIPGDQARLVAVREDGDGNQILPVHDSMTRERPVKLRRRSTNWAAQSPQIRQKKLEDVIELGSADTFFSLHCENVNEPIYLSEVVLRARNPSYQSFDLTGLECSRCRESSFRFKLWVKQHTWTLHLDYLVRLSELSFVGKLGDQPPTSNSVLFQLVDGLYSMSLSPIEYPPPKPSSALPTSSYGALMRLASLDDSIRDALATREQIAAQISAILLDQTEDTSEMAEDAAVRATKYVISSRKLVRASLRRRTELLLSLQKRKADIERGRSAQKKTEEDISNAEEKLQQSQHIIAASVEEIRGQRRRICEELLRIFPIEPTAIPLLFTICGLRLPNSSFEETTTDHDDTYSAALGLAARLVDMLQYYLSVMLPYPLTPYGSRSVVSDNISTLPDAQRVFPLYIRGTVRFRFDYAVFLLNKNIECLVESQGIKVIDIRHTLPNLKYLLYVCCAGAGQLPARKAGGIRGLLSGRMASPTISRRGSDDSVTAVPSAELGNQVVNGNKRMSNLGVGEDLGRGLSFRTKGMRESLAKA